MPNLCIWLIKLNVESAPPLFKIPSRVSESIKAPRGLYRAFVVYMYMESYENLQNSCSLLCGLANKQYHFGSEKTSSDIENKLSI